MRTHECYEVPAKQREAVDKLGITWLGLESDCFLFQGNAWTCENTAKLLIRWIDLAVRLSHTQQCSDFCYNTELDNLLIWIRSERGPAYVVQCQAKEKRQEAIAALNALKPGKYRDWVVLGQLPIPYDNPNAGLLLLEELAKNPPPELQYQIRRWRAADAVGWHLLPKDRQGDDQA